MPNKRPDDLREACVREAFSIIETVGLESLSLREVARRLGVSHQAPYKHFPSRDHILAEVIRRSYDRFAEHLDSRSQTGEAKTDLVLMGEAYLQFALTHPLQYRLIFSTPLPDPVQHPDMLHSARHAFDILRDAMRVHHAQNGLTEVAERAEKDALFAWATLHGLAGILQTNAIKTLDLSPEVFAEIINHTFQRLGLVLDRMT